jgi:hypothetical protein
MAFDKTKFTAEVLRELTKLGTDIRADLWNKQNKAFLKLMAQDVAGLTVKLQQEKDPKKRQRYRRSIDLITNHVAVMAFSRLNVVEQGVKETVLKVLQKAAALAVKALLAGVGL